MITRFAVLAAVVLIGVATADGLAAGNDRWSTYQGSENHWGYVPQTVLPSRALERWRRKAQGGVIHGLAVDHGQVFTTPHSLFLQEVPLVVQRLVDGELAWRIDFGDIYSAGYPTIDDGRIYLQTANGWIGTYLHCYDVDGGFQWRTPFPAQWNTFLAPTLVDGDIYFNGGTYGGLYSLDGNGKTRWFTQLPQFDGWSPTWFNGTLLAYTNVLTVVEPSTGLVLGRIHDPDYAWAGYTVDQAPVVVGTRAYVTNGGRLVAFDLASMQIAWARGVGASGQVSTDGEQLFVVAGGALSVHDPVTGDRQWSWVPSPSGAIATRIIVTDSHVIVGDQSQTYLVNRGSRQTEQTLPVSGALAYAADTLVIGMTDGNVAAYHLPTEALFADDFE